MTKDNSNVSRTRRVQAINPGTPLDQITSDHARLLETITDHVQQLLQRVQDMEAAQNTIIARLEQLEVRLRQDTRAAVVEVGALRTELLGERKSLSALGVFNGVLPMLDSLRAMQAAQANTESPVYHQIDALINSLTMMLRGLGFSEFTVAVGEPFDPTFMECTGYAHGQTGIVLEASRIGYRTQAGVIRPVGVTIAAPNVSLS